MMRLLLIIGSALMPWRMLRVTSFSVGDAVLLVAFFWGAMEVALRSKKLFLRREATLLLLMLGISASASSFALIEPLEAVWWFLQVAFLWIVVFHGYYYGFLLQAVEPATLMYSYSLGTTLLAGLFMLSALGIVGDWAGSFLIQWGSGYGAHRFGPGFDANDFSIVVGMALGPLFERASGAYRAYTRVLAMLMCVILLSSIAYTASRTGFVVAAVSVGTFVWWGRGARQWLAIGLIAMALSFFVIANFPQFVVLTKRLVGSLGANDISGRNRIYLLHESWSLIRNNPFIGVGPDQLAIISSLGQKVHNSWLLVWTETGLPGLLFSLLPMAVTLRIALRHRRQHPGLLASILALLTSTFFMTELWRRYLWIIPIIMVTSYFITSKRQLTSDSS